MSLPQSVRERVMAHLAKRFEKQNRAAGYHLNWDCVTRRPLTREQAKLHSSVLGLYDAKERKSHEIGYSLATLEIVVEFFTKAMMGDDRESLGTLAAGEVERQMLSDINCGGLTLDLQVRGSELDLEGSDSMVAAGIVTFVATYRHALNDPFKLIGE